MGWSWSWCGRVLHEVASQSYDPVRELNKLCTLRIRQVDTRLFKIPQKDQCNLPFCLGQLTLDAGRVQYSSEDLGNIGWKLLVSFIGYSIAKRLWEK